MPNRAAQLRAAIQAAYPGAIIHARGPNWIRHQLPDGSFALDTTIDPLHLDDGAEIDTTVQDSADGNYDDQSGTTPYLIRQRNGVRRLWPRRDVLTEFIDLGAPEFQRSNLTWGVISWASKSRVDNVITFNRVDAQLQIVLGPGRLKMNLVLLSAPAATRWRFPVSLTGLTRQGTNLIAASDGATVARVAPFTLTDATGVTRDVAGTLTGHPTFQGAYVVEPDLSGLSYPVAIDPTVDVSVAVETDDAYWRSDDGFRGTLTVAAFGLSATSISYHSAARFASVAVPQSATINVAYVTVIAAVNGSAATCNVNIYAEAADNPAAVTTAADANGRAVTTAAAWSAVPAMTAGTSYQTPSIVTPIQEVVDRVGWASGNAIQIFIKNNGSSVSAFRQAATVEHATYAQPSLHIEYTSAEQTISAAFLSSDATLYAATLTHNRTISAAAIASGSMLYVATLTHNRTISAAAIASGSVLYVTTITTGPVTISAALLGPTSTLYTPTISPVYTINAAFISSGSVLYAATLTPSYTLSAAFIGSGATLYTATLTPGEVTIIAALLASGSVLYTGTLAGGPVTISAAFISSGLVLYTGHIGYPGVQINGMTITPRQVGLVATARQGQMVATARQDGLVATPRQVQIIATVREVRIEV